MDLGYNIFEGLVQMPWWGYGLVVLLTTHITCLAVTIYLHRHMAHRGLDLHPVITHFFRLWLWLTTGMNTKEWVAVHRKHHATCETEEDPHSPRFHGIWKVLFGGVILYQKETLNKKAMETFGRGAPDDWVENHLYKPNQTWGCWYYGLFLVLVFGLVPGLIMTTIQMLWIPFWAAGVINGVGHYLGYRNYNTKDDSTNIIPWGIIIAGEELHNNHHAHASSARFASQWFEFDIGWIYIRIFEALGLAKVHKVAPKIAFDPSKTVCDGETLKAVVTHRMLLMQNFKKALMETYREELRKLKQAGTDKASADWRALKEVKRLLLTDASELSSEETEQLNTVLANHKVLESAYNLRSSLISLWERTQGTQEELVSKLEEWCLRAEQTGSAAFEKLSQRVRTFALA